MNAIRSVVNKFLNKFKSSKCQIVNLGAGYDTLFMNLIDQNNTPTKYIEIDFPRVVSSKIRLIRSKKNLSEKFQFKTEEPTTTKPVETNSVFKLPTPTANFARNEMNEINLENFSLISVDLRRINDLDRKLSECNIDRSLPTLFISECVLVYMSAQDSSVLLQHLATTFSQCCFLKYEQCNLNDKFGEIMLENMQLRSCKLLGVEVCESIETQKNSFINNGFDSKLCQVITMTNYYQNIMNKNERERIESIEFLDEAELLFQLLDHYCICLAANNQSLNDIFL